MTNFEELGTFDTSFTDDQQGDGLPRIWWHHGDPKGRPPRGGDFYTRADYFADGLGAPWQEASRFSDEIGYSADTLHILPITYRVQAFVKDEAGQRTYLPEWVKGASLHTELLCLVEGIEGPVVWSMKGTVGKAVTDPKGSIFATAKRTLTLEAERRLRKRVPPWAFWLPVTTLKEGGKVKFVKLDQGSVVTPPMLELPPHSTTEELLNSLYAGRENIERCAALREEYATWRQERRANAPAAQQPAQADEEGYEPAAAPPARRNVPQPVSDDEFPF